MYINLKSSFYLVRSKVNLGWYGYYNLSILHSMTLWRMLMHYLENLYLCRGVKVRLGSFGVTGVKRLFCQKCYNLPMLNSLNIRLMHIHQLQILHLNIYAIGSWVTRGYHLGHSTIGQGSCLCLQRHSMSKLLFKSSLVTRNMILVTLNSEG